MATGERLEPDALWDAWRRIVRAMTVRGLVWDSAFSRSAWTQWGSDYVSGLRRNASSRRVAAIVQSLGPGDMRRLHAIAGINHRRLEAIARWTAIGLVTLPASAALALNQLAPQVLRRFRWDSQDLVAAAALLAWIGWVMMAAWRARQTVVVMELAMIEADVLPTAAEDDPDDPVQAPLGA
jgi:hypothetical protein